MGATVHGEPGHSSPQEAIDAALAAGTEFHGRGYRVGPPWYLPVPIHGSDPPEYLYEGRVRYGDDTDALMNRFYSLLYEFEDAAILEAEQHQAELLELGYEVYETELEPVTFDGRLYVQATFYFGMPGATFSKEKSRWYLWAIPAALVVTVGVVVVVGEKMR